MSTDKNYDTQDMFFAIIIGFLSAVLLFACIGKCISGSIKVAAVNQGHAEYYLDANHERQWRWLPKGDGPVTTATVSKGEVVR